MNQELILEISEYAGADAWFWRLTDAAGNFIASHPVALAEDNSEACGYRGYHDLTGFLATHAHVAGNGDRHKGETAVLAGVGRWMGEQVLGDLRPKLCEHVAAAGGMLAVRVMVPAEAQGLIAHPLELAWLEEGKTLAEAGARLIWHRIGAPDGSAAKDSGGALRVLGVFSLPTNASPLNLRKERAAFKTLLHEIAETRGLDVETHVLQYGVTREALKEALLESPGWDVIHFSCHGTKGALLLEKEDGSADLVRYREKELADLLRPTRPRLKLLSLSACLSGAPMSLERTRLSLGLPAKADGRDAQPEPEPEEVTAEALPLPSLAQDLAEGLDCAALAMRYSVGDEFAIALAAKFYREMIEHGQPAAKATQIALKHALEADGDAPALSPITPMLVGPRAATLRLEPPPKAPAFRFEQVGLQEFPPPPEHFVGRVGIMLRASKALATAGGRAGVLFHGMAGGGKTACALELAHLHDHKRRFQGFVWFECPKQGEDIQQALFNCLEAIARQLRMEPAALIGNLDDPERFRQRTVPALRQFFAKNAVLVVIDNMEGLLSPKGAWLDQKWGDFVGALTGHDGLSRAVLTSRTVPSQLTGSEAILIENVTALSLGEALLLARELPNLGRLYAEGGEGLALVREALDVVQGHPKLLGLADRLAADRGRLAGMVNKAREAAERGGAPLQAFFREGESEQDVADFTRALEAWTAGLVATLPPTARLLFQFLCRMEDDDRVEDYIRVIWRNFLERLGEAHAEAKAALAEPEDGLAPALAAVVDCGLAGREHRRVPTGIEVDEETQQPRIVFSEVVLFAIHPGVAEAGLDDTPETVSAAVDRELGDFYLAQFLRGEETEMEGGGGLLVAAARRAVPYLIRAERWEEAATLLERMITRDSSPAAVLWALPLLRRIAEVTRGTAEGADNASVLATTLLMAGRYDEAEPLLRDVIAHCGAAGDWRRASTSAGGLVDLLRRLQRLPEALDWTEKKAAYTRRAGLGPWTQLADDGQRLQVLSAMGRWREVLETVEAKRKEMDALAEESGAEEAVAPWNVRETLLNTGAWAALGLKEWETMLRLNAQVVQWTRERGASEHEIARTQFNNYSPLLRLRRFADARRLLEHCRDVFEREQDYAGLGSDYSALARLNGEEGRPAEAARFEQAALKYKYAIRQPDECAISHNNLANYLERAGEPRDAWVPHRLASALLDFQAGSGGLQTSLRNLALSDLPASPPAFHAVADAVEQLDGVRFRQVFAGLPQTYGDGDAALAALWEQVAEAKGKRQKEKEAREALLASLPPAVREALQAEDEEALRAALEALPQGEPQDILQRLADAAGVGDGGGDGPDMEEVLREFEPLLRDIAEIALAESGAEVPDAFRESLPELRRQVEAALEQHEQKGWHLRGAAQRIWSGERDAAALTADLDDQDTQLIHRVLDLIHSQSPDDTGA